MSESKVSRTLLKSPPELWSEVSTAASLQRHMDHFGEIRITKLEPETAVAWEGEHARGTITLEVSGWGTKVNLTAELVGTEGVDEPRAQAAGQAEPVGDLIEPEPVVEHVEHVGCGDLDAPVQKPPWTQRMARAFRKWFSPPPLEDDAASHAEPAEPTPIVPEPQPPAASHSPIPEPAPQQETPPQLDEASTAALDAALSSLGQAHHRPFSRA